MTTYSTSLKLTLIGDGEETGTWGSTTNTNLGTLLEQAIVGQTTVIMANADYTLTNLNGTTDESRNAVLILTGNQNASYSVIVPNVPKLYMVTNSLNSSAIAYIKPSGGSTFQIPNGRTMYLYSNGSAFTALDYVQYAQNLVTGGGVITGAITCTSLTSSGAIIGTTINGTTIGGTTITASTQFSGPGTGLTGTASSLTAANISGTLAVNQGGTGAVAVTGSGNNVLSTSPTLVTPILGTPTSGNLANCTGYPAGSITGTVNLATQVTGTLAVTNGGTGVNTSTGTGSVVLSTSPTLITPLLGTPTSGVLTNTTGLPLTTGVTGILPIANGGSGTSISTGTGSLVLSSSPTIASPTLTTPVLGTPTSGNLANCTSLPLTTGVTGTLPVANGGTGVTSSTGTGSVVLSASPTLTGSPIAPTQTAGTNNTTIATTAYVATAVTNATGSLGTMSTQNANAVAITGGTINGVSGTNASMTVGTAGTVSTTVASGATGTTQAAGTNNTTMATTAFVQAAMQALHPVGSIYTSTSATNPGTAFGFGTWIAFGAGRVMIGAGGGYTAGDMGGSANAIVVSHTHSITTLATSGQSQAHVHGVSGTTGNQNQDHIHAVSGTTGGQSVGHQHTIVDPAAGVFQNVGANFGNDWQTGGYGSTANGSYNTGFNSADHNHSFAANTSGNNVSHQHALSTTSDANNVDHTHTLSGNTDSNGSSGTNANLQPYVVVYMWNRTA